MLPKSRILAIVLLGVGAALIVAGLLLPRFVHADNRIPLSLGEATWTVVDEDARTRVMTDPSGRVVTAPVSRQLHVTLTEPSNEDEAAVRAGTTVMRGSQQAELDRLITAGVWTYTMDRLSGTAVGDGAVSDQMATPPATAPMAGSQWWKFPAPAAKGSYQVFDDTLRRATEATFEEETQLGGKTVYRYRQVIEPTNLRELYPGVYNTATLADGQTAYLFYEATRDLFVDPDSGLVVDVVEDIDQYYGTTPGDRREVVLDFSGEMPEDEVASLQADAAMIADAGIVGIVGWVAVGVGALAVVFGAAGTVLAGRHTRRGGVAPNRGVAR